MSTQLYGVFGTQGQTVVRVALETAEVKYENKDLQKDELKGEELKKINVQKKVPCLTEKAGSIVETNAILRHVARISKNKLYGANLGENFQVDQWLDAIHDAAEFQNQVFGAAPFNSTQQSKSVSALQSFLAKAESTLKGSEYLVGKQLTIADIAVFSLVKNAFAFAVNKAAYPSVQKWFAKLHGLKAFAKYHGSVPRYCNNAWAVYQKQEAPKPEQKPKEKKVEAPKVVKPKKKSDEVEDVDESGKKKNPLDLLPESKFNFFDFKTMITNTDKKQSCEFLWKNYDPKGFSFWKIDYEKYEGEGEKIFMTCNLKNGFLSRLEHFRKYSYAVHGVYGTEPNLEIRGVWMWRGTEIPFEVTDHPSYEYNKYTRLSHEKAEDRKLLEDYWCNTKEDVDKVEGLTVIEAKAFK